jgi:hypothetical protein
VYFYTYRKDNGEVLKGEVAFTGMD